MATVFQTRLAKSIYLVRLAGEFDMANISAVAVAMDAGIADEDSTTLALDLHAVTFLDSSFIEAVIEARDRAQHVRKRVWLVRPAPIVWRVFQVTMIDALFRDFGSVSELEEYAQATAVTASHA